MRFALVPWPGSALPTDAALRAALAAGEMTFTVDGHDFTLGRPGDRVLLPAGTVHAARAGTPGATYLIASARRP